MDKKFLSESIGKLIDIKQDLEALAEEFDTVVFAVEFPKDIVLVKK